MSIKKFPLIGFTISYILGILLSSAISINNIIIYIFIIILVILIIEKIVNRLDFYKSVLILLSTIVVSAGINYNLINNKGSSQKASGEFVFIKEFYSNNNLQSGIIKGESNKILAFIPIVDSIYLEIGERIFINDNTSKIINLGIPNTFNFSQYLKNKNIVLKVDNLEYIKVKDNKINAFKTNRALNNIIDSGELNYNSKAIIKALVLGNKDDISDSVISSFSNSGIMHLLALSGLHIAILTLFLNFMLLPLTYIKSGALVRSIIIILLLWTYAYITGFSNSIVRSTIMFSIITIGQGLKKESNIYNNIAIAALILIIINPLNIYDVGFQLSFSAVIGIVWIYPILNKILKPKNTILKYIWSLFCVSIAAQIATLPLTIFYFNSFSSLFFIANLIVIPTITVLLVLSYIYMLLVSFGIEFSLLNLVYNNLIVFIELASSYIASLDVFIFKNLYLSTNSVIIIFAFTVTILVFYKYRKVKYVISIALLIISLQLNKIHELNKLFTSNTLMVAASSSADIVIRKSGSIVFSRNDSISIFNKYAKANNLTKLDLKINDIFNYNSYLYWNLNKEYTDNVITTNHNVIIGNKIINNPSILINKNTKGVIFTGYKNSLSEKRWEYYCKINILPFYNCNDSLYTIKTKKVVEYANINDL